MFDLWPPSVFEWWSEQPWQGRYGSAVLLLLSSAILYFAFDMLWYWGWGGGAVLLVLAMLVRDDAA